jgi:PKD repeat protein
MVNDKLNTVISWRIIISALFFGFILLNVGIPGLVISGLYNADASNTGEMVNNSRSNTIISTDTTWTLSNSPYNVTGNVLVESGATLTIDPGVVVRMGAGNYIQVEGKLIAEGTANKMITFTLQKSNYWNSIKFTYNAKNGSSIKYCNFEYAKNPIIVNYAQPSAAPNITYCDIQKSGPIIYSVNGGWSTDSSSNTIAFNNISEGIELNIFDTNVSIKNNILFKGIKFEIQNSGLFISNNSITGENHGIWCYRAENFGLVIKNNLIAGVGKGSDGIHLSSVSKNLNNRPILIKNNTIFFREFGIRIPKININVKINITYNIIRNNKFGILGIEKFKENSIGFIFKNNIYNNTFFNVKNTVPKTEGNLDFRNNWWGTIKSDEINKTIYDFYDDFNLGKVLYTPYLTSKLNIYKPYNLPPVADAGPDQDVFVDETVIFDYSNSYDPNNYIVNGKWDFGDGNYTEWENILNNSYNEISHTYEKIGNYSVMLTVFDGLLYDTDTRWINVSKIIIPNKPPTIYTPSTIELYEDSYLDPALDLWDYTGDEKTPTNLLNFSIIGNTNPNCVITLESNRYIVIKPAINWYGNSTITIRVDDGELNNTVDIVIIVIPVRESPIAKAGWDLYAKVNTTVAFNGSGSYDNDNDILTYNWTFGDGTYTGWQNASNTTHLYNKTGKYKALLTVTDAEFIDSDFINVFIYSNATSKPPWILSIPDIYVHYYSPVMSMDYFGYSYDFSYFINDVDNNKSELTIRADPDDNNLSDYIENDLNNSMNLIFKIPLELANGKKYPINLYVKDLDPRNEEVSKAFNITVTSDAWPVELFKKFPKLNFDEDFGKSEDVFNIANHFFDRDSTTTFEILNTNSSKITGEIDNNLNVDLISNKPDFFGNTEIVIHAHDTQPVQDFYAIAKVTINPVNDPPELSGIPEIIIPVNTEKAINLTEYIKDIDTKFYELSITSNDPDHGRIDGSSIVIKYDKLGKYSLTIVVDDGEFTVSQDLIISVVKKDSNPVVGNDTDNDGISDTWELQFGFNPNDPTDANLDPDNDTLTNLMEFILGTNPNKFDTDDDGVTDNKDAFPTDPAASVDTDGDKYPNYWNPNKSEEDSNSGLKLDAYPNDPKKYLKERTENDYLFIILIVCVIIFLLIFASLKLFMLRSKRQRIATPSTEDETLNLVKHNILEGDELSEMEYSHDELERMLEDKLKSSQMSEETYKLIKTEVLCSNDTGTDQITNSPPVREE